MSETKYRIKNTGLFIHGSKSDRGSGQEVFKFSQVGSVPVRFRFGSGSVPVRFRFGSGSVPVRSGPVRFGSVRSVRFGSVRFGSVRFGSVRFGSVRFGSVRFGSGGVSNVTGRVGSGGFRLLRVAPGQPGQNRVARGDLTRESLGKHTASATSNSPVCRSRGRSAMQGNVRRGRTA